MFKSVKLLTVLTMWAFIAQSQILAEEKLANSERKVQFPLPNPSDIGSSKFSSLLNEFLLQGGYESWKKDLQPRATGPFFVRDSGLVESFGVHGPSAVKVYYSPQVWDWMSKGRKGVIADGGMIVKVLYARDPNDLAKFSNEISSFSVMVKDSKGSWDGWFYSDGGPTTSPIREHGANFFDPNAGFALSCINCHATADNVESTYSSARNVTAPSPHIFETKISPEGMKKGPWAIGDIHVAQQLEAEVKHDAKLPSQHWRVPANSRALQEPPALPFATFDHVPQGPRPDGHRHFVTASNCSACHDASKLYSALPNMAFTTKDKNGDISKDVVTNLSPFSEWRYSMMGLSGRDPVFFAQLESERERHPELAGNIENNCLSCHAPMGQRQWLHDRGAQALLSQNIALSEPGSPHEKVGALSRDGVSCVICHQMSPEGLGDPKSFTGNFKLLEKPTELFGPYEKVATLPMEQAMGVTPKLGAHLADAKLCASCHTVDVPVLDRGRKYSADEFAHLASSDEHGARFHEQTTFLEWKNSGYPAQQKSCQSCHMPRTFNNQQLKFKIANIEDETFPAVDNRARDEQLHMEPREPYSRHALHGINVFALELFNQNPWLLGVPRKNNLMPDPRTKSGFDVARESMLQMANEQTANVKIISAKREKNRLIARVQVTNLAGHKFPSGVSFRRAFIEFAVKAGEKTLWISGGTDKWGVIGNSKNGEFVPLNSEFFVKGNYQPHYQTIARQDQVQIYEELIAGSDGEITTSFLNLKKIVKDNRLLPRGWKLEADDAIQPVGIGDDAEYKNGEAADVVTYEVPLEVGENSALSVSATLYYQSLPPYYLRQRFENLDGPAAQRLYYLINQLELENTQMRDWKLKISADQKALE